MYRNNGRKCIWNGKRVFYKICQYVGCVKQKKKKKKYCHVCNQTIEIENIDIDDIENRIKTQDNIKLSDLIKDRYGKWLFFKNHIIYALWLGKELKYTTKEDWYDITTEQIHKNGGGGLLNHYYKDSLQAFVMTVFPDYNWDPCKFSSVPNGHWQELDNHKHWAEDLGKKLKYTTKEDWYDITQEQIYSNGGGGLLISCYKGSPQEFVMTVFPDYDWDPSKFNKHKTEAIVEKFLRINYQIETQKIFEWCKNIRCLPFDFYIEELKIIIELTATTF